MTSICLVAKPPGALDMSSISRPPNTYSCALILLRRSGYEPVNSPSRSRVGHQIRLASLVFAERHDRQRLVADRTPFRDAFFPFAVHQRPDLAGHIVSAQVVAIELGQQFAAIDGAAGNRFADVVMVFPDRLDQIGARADAGGAERVQALAQPPAVVAAFLDEVDFLVEILADVGGPELAGLLVERHAPDVAQAVGPGFGQRTRELTLLGSPAGERIVGRNRVILAVVFLVDVDAENLAERLLQVLAVVERIIRGAAIAERNVEIAIR